jgi:ATP-dependent DNA ligase
MAKRDLLIKKCELLHIVPKKSRNRVDKETKIKYVESTVDDCIEAIQDYYVNLYKSQDTLNPFVELILKHQPMLAAQMKNVKPEVQLELWKDNNKWLATEKIDGNRMRLCYDYNYGVEYFSRNLSEGQTGDFLPLAYSNTLSFPEINKEKLKELGINSFILDCELVPLYDDIRPYKTNRTINGVTTEVEEMPVADTGLSLTTSILGALPELSHRMQETNPLKLMCFDLIMVNGEDYSDQSLAKRLAEASRIVTILKNEGGLSDRLQPVKAALVNKETFYQNIVNKGGEGCVLKDLTSKYTGLRDGNWVKAKRTVTGSMLEEKMGDTLDVFIIGFKKGNEGTNIENLVGALDFGTYLLDDENNYLLDESGMPIIHPIATISGLSLEDRQAMTELDANGEPTLKLSWYYRVAEIDGQDVSSKNYKLAHARLIRWRPDRTSETCSIKKSFIESLVL